MPDSLQDLKQYTGNEEYNARGIEKSDAQCSLFNKHSFVDMIMVFIYETFLFCS